jgi:hypothetical protein
MERKIVRQAALLCIMALGPVTAHAVSVTWYLSGVTFSDGGTATGSFVYDATAMPEYSSINITTTAGSVLSGASYIFLKPGHSTPYNLRPLVTAPPPADLTGTHSIGLGFSTPLNFASGIVPLVGATEVTCSTATCNTAGAPFRNLTAGVVTTTNPTAPAQGIPTMSTYTLLLTILGLLLVGGIALVTTKRSNHA